MVDALLRFEALVQVLVSREDDVRAGSHIPSTAESSGPAMAFRRLGAHTEGTMA